MKSIEINTSQNVAIEYELASIRDRILAFAIDLIIMWVSIFILSALVIAALPQQYALYVRYFVVAPIFFFYTPVFEIFNGGQSLGKKALNMKVTRVNGEEMKHSDYLVRCVFRAIDIYLSAGGLATLLIISSQKNQRLGDLLANTAVIKDKPNNSLKLGSILRMNSLENYKIDYPEARIFSEEDMLLVKKVIERHKKYANEAHERELTEITKLVAKRLSLQTVPKNKPEFLKKVLKDYIVLTR